MTYDSKVLNLNSIQTEKIFSQNPDIENDLTKISKYLQSPWKQACLYLLANKLKKATQ